MRLFFLTIPKPLKQHPFLKKIIHSALRGVGSPSRRLIHKDTKEKLHEASIYLKGIKSLSASIQTGKSSLHLLRRSYDNWVVYIHGWLLF